VLLLLIFFGCGDVKDNNVTPNDTTTVTTEAPTIDTTKTEETTAPPETEKTIIWASEPDGLGPVSMPVQRGWVELKPQLENIVETADDDAVVAISIGAGCYTVPIDPEITYGGKTLEEYHSPGYALYLELQELREKLLKEGINANEDERYIELEAKYAQSEKEYIDVCAYIKQESLKKCLIKHGFDIIYTYDESTEITKWIPTVSVKNLKKMIENVEGSEEGYILGLAVEGQNGIIELEDVYENKN